MRRVILCVGGLCLAGCGEAELAKGGADNFDSAMFDTGAADTGGTDGDSETPVWWRLGATLDLLDGAIQKRDSTLDISLSGADDVVICEESLPISRATSVVATPDAVVLAWWRIAAADPTGDCASWTSPLSTSVFLGIGDMHPDIEASLDPLDLAAVSDSLNGAYASLDGGDTVYVYGVAGTVDAYAGAVPAADALPLADGTWTVLAVYPFAYSS